jgi:hypothetical protein
MRWDVSPIPVRLYNVLLKDMSVEERKGGSLIRVAKKGMGELNAQPNWLRYEGSKFETSRNDMRG